MSEYPIIIFVQSSVKFRILDPKIQMKRAKCFILTYLLTYILTAQVIESAYSSSKST